ncbi:dihydroneopterin aldolase [Bacillus glycinifermentans]|uniref:7,8-dihydroneopterin aldolase n=2 Tax=Bacillus glycinifermentans TaxID=1664069 RepID=A0ABU6H9V5_9BACI|nr:dihydroneopterin aldolase [Bacillus glycinifermentans]ATH95560.1 dihydroneopterin aldolase [Bacillus glycinifermentans]MEC0487781.1 dihydroneopterin aldolase [Bacillus glycinifermentans]MEC0495134.1 dihydroneopterin aldolase [Bacillus glycinifermentans]MEC0542832.1 dihydroneopterin aldolase [Bacillus glycinifermentans]MEC3609664.1 dihydroneopterin aldolase [Bacillus glycinifermentans]
MDKVYVEGMEFYGYHGVFEEENKLGQRFRVDLTAHLDLSEAGKTDRIDATINYAELYKLCKEVVEGEPVNLVETLAETIAGRVLKQFQTVQECTVKVIKPDPPIPGHYKSVAIEMTRKRT